MASKDVVKINYKAKYFYKIRAEEIVKVKLHLFVQNNAFKNKYYLMAIFIKQIG